MVLGTPIVIEENETMSLLSRKYYLLGRARKITSIQTT